MNFRQLQSFLTVAQQGSYASAAKQLFVSPSALVQQIRALEDDVGFPLFSGKSRGVALSDAGKVFYEDMRKMTDQMAVSLSHARAVADSQRNVLRVGLQNNGLFLPNTLLRLAFAFKKERALLELRFVDMDYANAFEAIERQECDVLQSEQMPDLARRHLRFLKLFDIRAYCLLSPLHPLAEKSFIAPGDLAGQRVYVHTVANLDALMGQLALQEDVHFIKSDVDTYSLYHACLMGGIYIIRLNKVRDMSPLVLLPLAMGELRWNHGIVYSAQPTPVTREFLDEVKKSEHLRA